MEKLVKEEQRRGEEMLEVKAKELAELHKDRDRRLESLKAEKEFLRQELQQMRTTLQKAKEQNPAANRGTGRGHGESMSTAVGGSTVPASQTLKRKDISVASGIDE